jgi:hypothetical protein
MKNLIIVALFLGASLCAHAQVSTKPNPQPDSLIKIIYEGRHQLYTIGGKLVSPEDVRARLLSYPASAAEFNMAKRNITWAYISLGASAVSSFASLIEFKNNDKLAGATFGPDGSIIYQQHSHTGAYIFTGLATGFLFSTFYNIARAGHHGNKALKYYNERFE